MKNQIGQDVWVPTRNSPEKKFPGIVYYESTKREETDPEEGRKHTWFVDYNPNLLLLHLLGNGYQLVDFACNPREGEEIIVDNGIDFLKILVWARMDIEEAWIQYIIMPV